MKCTEYFQKTNNKGGLSSEFASEDLVQCDGEIEKIWKDGIEINCKCGKCGKYFGKGYIDREKFIEGFAIW